MPDCYLLIATADSNEGRAKPFDDVCKDVRECARRSGGRLKHCNKKDATQAEARIEFRTMEECESKLAEIETCIQAAGNKVDAARCEA